MRVRARWFDFFSRGGFSASFLFFRGSCIYNAKTPLSEADEIFPSGSASRIAPAIADTAQNKTETI